MLLHSWKSVVRFKPREFDDPQFPGSGIHIDAHLVLLLDKLALSTNYRIMTHWKIGGAIDMQGTHGHARKSYHRYDMGCRACDFHMLDHDYQPLTINLREQYIKICEAGFSCVIVYPWWKPYPGGFHADVRPRTIANHMYSPSYKEYTVLFPSTL